MTVFVSHVPRPLNGDLPVLHVGYVRSMEHIETTGSTTIPAVDGELVVVVNDGDDLVTGYGPAPAGDAKTVTPTDGS